MSDRSCPICGGESAWDQIPKKDEFTHECSECGTLFTVVDRQLLSRGRGVWDVAYLLSQNLAPEDRRAIEMDLLGAYHQLLVDNCSNAVH